MKGEREAGVTVISLGEKSRCLCDFMEREVGVCVDLTGKVGVCEISWRETRQEESAGGIRNEDSGGMEWR